MRLDAPILFLRHLIIDCVRRPRTVQNVLAYYENTRSFSYPVGSLPAISIFDVVANAAAIPVVMQGIFEIPLFPREHKAAAAYETASTSLRDAYYLALLVKHLDARNIIEVGTSFGESALLFAMNTREDARVRTLDIQNGNPTVGSRFRSTAYKHKIQEHCCSLAELKSKLSTESFDFIFIDGDHSCRGVLEDSYTAQALLRPGGIICWHDYSFRFRHDVVRALDRLRVRENWDINKLLYTNLCIYIK